VTKRLEDITRDFISALGEDPARTGLARTPERVARAWELFTSGYDQTVQDVIGDGVFPSEGLSQMVVVKDIEFYSMCEHHLLPFFGRAHIGYIPDQKIVGLSKLARITDLFSRRLQVQERLTEQIAHSIMELLEPRGVGVMLDAVHLCMSMRGVAKQSSTTVTTSVFGIFRDDPKTRGEFFATIQSPLGRQ
jgi:GTP cyclohydrolase IA